MGCILDNCINVKSEGDNLCGRMPFFRVKCCNATNSSGLAYKKCICIERKE